MGYFRYSLAKTLRRRDWLIITFENVPIEMQLSFRVWCKYERSGTDKFSSSSLHPNTFLYPIDKSSCLLRAPLQL